MLRGQSLPAGQTLTSPVVTGGLTVDAIAGSDTSLDIAGLAGTVGTGTTAGTVGGAVVGAAGAGGEKTGTGHAAGGVGGAATLASGEGGATASDGSDAGGAGGQVAVTAGDGGAATAGTGNGGEGGSITLTPGTGGATTGGTAGISGAIRLEGLRVFKQAAPAAKTTTTTLTPAEIIGSLITANQGAAGAATYTLPNGTDLQAALPSTFATDDAFEFSVVNISTVAAEDVTIAGDTGTTLVGSGAVASNAAATDKSSGLFRVRKTGNNAFSIYRVS